MTNDMSEMTARRTGDGAARRPAARVLIAEDERDVAELIRYTLAREGFEVMVAANGPTRPAGPGNPARPDAAGPDAAAGQRLGALPTTEAGPRHRPSR
jgi:hypothetical protein